MKTLDDFYVKIDSDDHTIYQKGDHGQFPCDCECDDCILSDVPQGIKQTTGFDEYLTQNKYFYHNDNCKTAFLCLKYQEELFDVIDLIE